MKTSTRERRDWTLLIFLIPIGICLMLIAGQFAVRLVPVWRVNAGMQSKLDPNNLHAQQNIPLQPISPAILTPLGWLDTFLTPGAGGSGDQNIVFPPFVVFEPSATPAVTASPPPTVATTQPSPTIPVTTSPTVVVTPSATRTPKPPVDPPTSTPPTSTPPTPTPPTPTPPTPTPPTPTPIPTGYPSTPPVLYALVTPPPDLGVNTPPNGIPGDIPSGLLGSYTVVNLGVTGVVVSNTPDANYDMIFYESLYGPGQIALDQISIGISNYSDGSSYYQVFNWGDNIPDTNTNVDTATLPPDPACTLGAPECDNRVIPTSDLQTDPATGISTGILIDVDNAPSAPPEGTYNYLVIVSPLSLDTAQVDTVVVTEVPIP
jgi:hypothetical protein